MEVSVTTSIGVAAYGVHGTQPNHLIDQADQAMYQAKLAGRDGVCVAGARTTLPDQML
ncbi:hypothetical protein KSC_023050 [Ktedonobacter sp. SOSP1-52]|uniref:GGDEF domain-containing protein n=1 Tax=Ktedonobacter sp. SOSP1-52 TaxID=2778366 RepID=UPI001915F4B5|nr:diguanylate cyclase [Ktedonobacter sp. SOSP1-52]GHO63413.1 hypothetical protein KSC_023050 [Ktedonobacter sp. SOSP1-52]